MPDGLHVGLCPASQYTFNLFRHRDEWSRVLICTAEATHDSVDYVRRAAITGLHELLRDDHRLLAASTGTDLTGRLVEAVIRAGRCDLDTETRCVYLLTVRSLVKHYGDGLSSVVVDRLLLPLVDDFKSQRYEYDNCCFLYNFHGRRHNEFKGSTNPL